MKDNLDPIRAAWIEMDERLSALEESQVKYVCMYAELHKLLNVKLERLECKCVVKDGLTNTTDCKIHKEQKENK